MAVDTSDMSTTQLDAIFPKRQLGSTPTNELRDMAIRYTNQIVGGSVSRLSEVEGSEADFAHLLWAHLIAMRNGEAESESQEGGSVSYSRISGELPLDLSETRFGRQAQGYLRDNQSIGVIKGRGHPR